MVKRATHNHKIEGSNPGLGIGRGNVVKKESLTLVKYVYSCKFCALRVQKNTIEVLLMK